MIGIIIIIIIQQILVECLISYMDFPKCRAYHKTHIVYHSHGQNSVKYFAIYLFYIINIFKVINRNKVLF